MRAVLPKVGSLTIVQWSASAFCRRCSQSVLGGGHEVALAKGIAVEDSDYVCQLVIGDEIYRLPDLPFARPAVAVAPNPGAN